MKLNEFLAQANITKVSDLVQAMVDGLNKPWVHVDMSSYGGSGLREVRKDGIIAAIFNQKEKREVCFGCAATNALCQIAGKAPDLQIDMDGYNPRSIFFLGEPMDSNNYNITSLESAFNCLRMGEWRDFTYNILKNQDILGLSLENVSVSDYEPQKELPRMKTEDYKKKLKAYKKYANYLKSKGI